MPSNELEHRRWNDERWASIWPKRERLTDEVTPFVLEAAALAPGERVLDIGCGGGKLALAAGRAVGDGTVTGADLSSPLLALARRRAEQSASANVSFERVDMQTDRVPGAPFDVAISQFGVMFFDEPVVAFGNIRAHLAPSGRLAFACWQPVELNPWMFGPALAAFAPPPPPPAPGKSPTGPFSLADPARATAILEAAGFEEITRDTHEFGIDAPQDAVYDEDQLALVGIPEERRPEAAAAVAGYLAPFALEGGLSRFPLAFQVFRAVSP